jgi:hypothetical protein
MSPYIFEGGDKITEHKDLITVDDFLNRVSVCGEKIKDVFVLSDDYRYIDELKTKRPEWNIYTLCNKDEKGYQNAAFNKSEWNTKRNNLVKLFAMVEACIRSDLHFGNEQACSGLYIRSRKEKETYVSIK